MLEFLFAALLIGDLHQLKEGVSFRLKWIEVKDEVVFYDLEAENRSPLIYDVDAIRCEIKDQKVIRRHAIQDIPMTVLSQEGDSLRIPPGKRAVWVVALRKEVLPPGQYLSIQLLERHGSRNLELKVGHRELLRARMLN
jgi:hypothetical protein